MTQISLRNLWMALCDRATVNDHDFAVHKTVPLAHHECRIFGEFFGASEASG
jgi:hypothetical protein